MFAVRRAPLISLTTAALVAGLAACGGDEQATGGTPVVVATAPQVEGLLTALAGPGVKVETVVPATADVHDLELRPSQVRALQGADLVLRPGRENDAWAQEALNDLDATQVDVAEEIPGDERHWWMDPIAAQTAAKSITAALDKVDPDGATSRAAALTKLEDEMRQLDEQTKTCLATIPAAKRKIVTDHDAIGAYAARYGLTVVGTIAPGSDPEASPSAKHITELEGLMRRERVAAVFPIAPHGSQLAARIASRTGAGLGEPLWADALPGATHDHDHAHEEASSETSSAETKKDAAAGEKDEHGHEGHAHEDEHGHADEHGHEGHADDAKPAASPRPTSTPAAAATPVEPTLQSAARLNAEAFAEALGASSSSCSPLLG